MCALAPALLPRLQVPRQALDLQAGEGRQVGQRRDVSRSSICNERRERRQVLETERQRRLSL